MRIIETIVRIINGEKLLATFLIPPSLYVSRHLKTKIGNPICGFVASKRIPIGPGMMIPKETRQSIFPYSIPQTNCGSDKKRTMVNGLAPKRFATIPKIANDAREKNKKSNGLGSKENGINGINAQGGFVNDGIEYGDIPCSRAKVAGLNIEFQSAPIGVAYSSKK